MGTPRASATDTDAAKEHRRAWRVFESDLAWWDKRMRRDEPLTLAEWNRLLRLRSMPGGAAAVAWHRLAAPWQIPPRLAASMGDWRMAEAAVRT